MTDEANPATVDILGQIISLLQKVEEAERQRVFQTVATFFDLGGRQALPKPSVRESTGSFSEDRDISPKEFLLEKKPSTDVERVACLAYYLTHYRSTPHFKTLDLSKLNTEAAQVKFSTRTRRSSHTS